MIHGRVPGVWKGFSPRLDVVDGKELDVDEKVFSGTRDPRSGDETTFPEPFRFVS